MDLLFVTWTVEPDIISSPLTIRWYGVFFAGAFMTGYYILKKFFKAENASEEWLDSVLLYVMVGTILGARLGHVFFYDWDYYSKNLGDIVKIWEGGLASHGGGIGIIIALWLYSKRVTKKPMFWILDRVAVVTALGAVFIRLGNLMNHEIIGVPTDKAWGFIFTKAHIIDPMIPRHPAQLYESFCYLITFGVLYFLFWNKQWSQFQGRIFGLFLIMLFSFRFIVEFVKNSQGGFESSLGSALSTGQWLSIPFVFIGLYFAITAKEVKA
jgi:phosphatidylglycerol---prolipoprotein diacylglyceryl transferase|tara:strand:+ start:4231 stop:5034 length:804 start_codon:yes stop_codon:yes gene_type:complete